VPGQGITALIVGGSGGSAGGVTPPSVTSISVDIQYALLGNATVGYIAGTVGLPTGDPNYSLLQSGQITIQAYAPNTNQAMLVQVLTGPFTGASAPFASTIPLPLPASDQSNWYLTATSTAKSGASSTPFDSADFTLNSISVMSVAVEEVPGTRYIDLIDQSTHTFVQFTPTANHSGMPFVATNYLFFRASQGSAPSYYWFGWDFFGPGYNLAVQYDILVCNGPSVDVVGASVEGAISGIFTPLTSPPAGSVISSPSFPLVIEPPLDNGLSFTVKDPSGNVLTSGAASASTAIYSGINSAGNPYAVAQVISTPPGDGDPNDWGYAMVLRWGSYDGTTFTPGIPGGPNNPTATYQLGVQVVNDGQSQSWTSPGLGPGLFINYPAPNQLSTALLPIEWIEITAYGFNRNSANFGTTPWDGTDSNTVLQTQTFLLHVGQGALQTNSANLVLNPFTPGTTQGLMGWVATSNPANVSTNADGQLQILDDATVEEQVPHACKKGQTFTLEFDLAGDLTKPGTIVANMVIEAIGGGTGTLASLPGVPGIYPAFETNVLSAFIPTTGSLALAIQLSIEFVAAGDTSSVLNWYVQNVVLVQNAKVGGPVVIDSTGAATISLASGGGGITNAYLAADAVATGNMQMDAVTNAQIADDAVEGVNLASAGIAQVFSGAIVLTLGANKPAIVLNPEAPGSMTIFAASNASTPLSPAGQTDNPYVQIGSGGILFYGGAGTDTGPATNITPTGVFIQSQIGSETFPFVAISTTNMLFFGGTTTIPATGGGYLSGPSVAITAGGMYMYAVAGNSSYPYIYFNPTTGIQITNPGNGTLSLSSTGFTLAIPTGASIAASGGSMTLTGTAGTVYINAYDALRGGGNIAMRVSGTASIDILYVSGGLYGYSGLIYKEGITASSPSFTDYAGNVIELNFCQGIYTGYTTLS
jgi:hypothetical protein